MGKTFWTTDEDATLRRLTAEGLSTREIGAFMHKTKGSIISRQHRLLLRSLVPPSGKGPAWTDEETTTLRGLIARGFADPEIAQTMGKSLSSVRNRSTRLGIIRPRRSKPIRVQIDFSHFVVPLKISLLDLRRRHCRFVCDEKDNDGLQVYCGHPAVHGTSWCSGHLQFVSLTHRVSLQAAE